MKKLKVAIVGTGKVAVNNYLPCLSAEDDVELGYYNRTRSKADQCVNQFGGQAYGSLQALMDWLPDTVFVLTREEDRYAASMALLELNPQRLFFEKPLVARNGQANVTEQDFADARALLKAADSRGCETAMIFNYRFFEHSLRSQRIVAERGFGQALNITGLVHYACWSHCIDLVHWLAGPVATVTALQGDVERTNASMSARDVTIAFKTVAGASGTLIGTTSLAWDFPLFELSFNFEHGRIRLQDLDGDMEVMDSRRMDVERYHIYGAKSRWDQYNSSFVKSIKAYIASIRQGQPPPVPGIAGLLELQVEASAKRSIAQNRPIDLSSEFALA